MGVKSCSRKDCTNVMCDTYDSNVGYICNECIQEFKEYLEFNQLVVKTEAQITRALSTFMNTSKDEGKMSVEQFFNTRTH